ncbi:MAG TPA: tetratricopeptide repeat protein [Nitrospiria bacterium]|jgi:tetratricopeptide (TPR) repeat protein
MPYKIRIPTKKNNTETIKVAHLSERLLDWYEDNQKNIFWTVIVVLVLGVGAGIWWYYDKSAHRKALILQYEASKSLQDAQLYEGDENATREAYQSGITKYKDLIRQFPRTPSSAVARYRMGNSYVAMGEFEQGIQAYREFLNRYGKTHKISPMVIQKLGYVYLERNELNEAEKQFKEVSELEGANSRDQSLFELAGIYEKMGQKEKATSIYKHISDQFSTSPIASEALARLKGLEPEQKPGEQNLKPDANEPSSPSSEEK